MLPAGGYLVMAFITDNPGAWLMHCHIVSLASSWLLFCHSYYAFRNTSLLCAADPFTNIPPSFAQALPQR